MTEFVTCTKPDGRVGKLVPAPIAPLAVITDQLDPSLSDAVNFHLRNRRAGQLEACGDLANSLGYYRSDYRVAVDLQRFLSGEGRAEILESVRGHDVFIICDVLNYGQYTSRFNRPVSLSPDDHFLDVLRMIAAIHGTAKRVNVCLPYLYEGRRYRRMNRGSLDCALILKMLFDFKVSNVFTFDAHDGRVANASPKNNFESVPTSLQIIEALLDSYPDLELTKDRFMVVSPDEATVDRCVYFASMLQVPLGIFYRLRDYASGPKSRRNFGKEFLGDNLAGRDVLMVDDMIDTGKTMVECAIELKRRGANRIFCAVSFAQFTKGFEEMNQAYEAGIISKVFSTNLAYRPPVLLDSKWYGDVNMSKYLALLIDSINSDASLAELLTPTKRLEKVIADYRAKQRGREDE